MEPELRRMEGQTPEEKVDQWMKKAAGEHVEDEEGEFRWSDAAIKALLVLRRRMKYEFKHSGQSKIRLYRHISEELAELGHKFSGTDCKKKFDNMTATYNKQKQNTRLRQPNRKNWKYSHLMDDILHTKDDRPSDNFWKLSGPETCDLHQRLAATRAKDRHLKIRLLVKVFKAWEKAQTVSMLEMEADLTRQMVEAEEWKLRMVQDFAQTYRHSYLWHTYHKPALPSSQQNSLHLLTIRDSQQPITSPGDSSTPAELEVAPAPIPAGRRSSTDTFIELFKSGLETVSTTHGDLLTFVWA